MEYGCGRDAPYGQRHSFCPKVLDNCLRRGMRWRERNVSYCKKKALRKCQFDTALELIQWLNCKIVSTQVWRLGMRANQFLKNTRWIFQIGVRRANVKQISCFSIFKISSVKIHIERGGGFVGMQNRVGIFICFVFQCSPCHCKRWLDIISSVLIYIKMNQPTM